MRKFLGLLVYFQLVFLMWSLPSQADWRASLGFAPNFSSVDVVDDQLTSDIGYGLTFDYFYDEKWYLHLAFDHFEFEESDPGMQSYLIGMGYDFKKGWKWSPYVAASLGLSDIKDFPLTIDDQTPFSLNFRGGVNYSFNWNWSLGVYYEYVTAFLDEGPADTVDIGLPFISLTYQKYSHEKKKEKPRDDDKDGVVNGEDRCPKTPRGQKVDEYGCHSNDDDKDGVVNSADRCPNTPNGVAVDEFGCEKRSDDDDKDGVLNTIDECPNTPEGTFVDERGCEADDTDSDQDGVADTYDQCPNTPLGTKVNGFGCQEQEKIEMRLVVNFDTNSAIIKSEYYRQLNKVAVLMKRNPKAKLRIEGHTDSVGSAAYNLVLSQRRAKAIRDYLVRGGLVKDGRVEARGFGESKPIATNKTAEGRLQNRRILASFSYE